MATDRNRKTRRAVEAQQRKTKNGAAPDGERIVLRAADRQRILRAQEDLVKIERRIAALELEKDDMSGRWRQQQAQLQALCTNALRAIGVDLEADAAAGKRWHVNTETLEVSHRQLEPNVQAAPTSQPDAAPPS